jgi:hypothetical protein
VSPMTRTRGLEPGASVRGGLHLCGSQRDGLAIGTGRRAVARPLPDVVAVGHEHHDSDVIARLADAVT